MKIHKLHLGGRDYDAVFNLNALEKLGEMAGPLEDGTPLDAHTIMKIWSTPYGLMKALLVLMAEGERLAGRELDIDEDWMKANLSPAEGIWLQRKIAAIMVEGMRMETSLGDDEEVDEVLEAIKKKVTKEDSPQDSSEPGE